MDLEVWPSQFQLLGAGPAITDGAAGHGDECHGLKSPESQIDTFNCCLEGQGHIVFQERTLLNFHPWQQIGFLYWEECIRFVGFGF